MKRILFVDDEPKVLAALQRMLRGMRSEWEMVFVESGAQALALMAESPFDVVVTDMLMPEMDGAELLTRIMQQYPQTVRVVLSGHSDREAVLRLVGPAHQYLSKPCETQVLRDTVLRAFSVRDLLADGKLKQLVSQVQSLPTVPAVYTEMLKELRSEDPSILKLGQLISQDLGLSAKMLQLVNSAFFGLPQQVSNPAEAIIYLGVETVKNVVLSLQLFSLFDKVRIRNFSFERLWRHSWATGVIAKRIVEVEVGNHQLADQAFIGGLLHDVGKLILATGLTVHYQAVLEYQQLKGTTLYQMEQEYFGSSHAAIGAYLLGLWGLPDAVVSAVALHHSPADSDLQEFNLVTALHAANALEHEKRANESPVTTVDMDYLAKLGLQDRLSLWRESAAVSVKEAA